jgi:hypothetical protein
MQDWKKYDFDTPRESAFVETTTEEVSKLAGSDGDTINAHRNNHRKKTRERHREAS